MPYIFSSSSDNPSLSKSFLFNPLGEFLLKEKVINLIDYDVDIRMSNTSIYEFCKYLAGVFAFISTSTGPMHLAGLSNSKTMSFFGSSSFASSKRWSTISSKENQYNFEVKENYTSDIYNNIQDKLIEIIS